MVPFDFFPVYLPIFFLVVYFSRGKEHSPKKGVRKGTTGPSLNPKDFVPKVEVPFKDSNTEVERHSWHMSHPAKTRLATKPLGGDGV